MKTNDTYYNIMVHPPCDAEPMTIVVANNFNFDDPQDPVFQQMEEKIMEYYKGHCKECEKGGFGYTFSIEIYTEDAKPYVWKPTKQ